MRYIVFDSKNNVFMPDKLQCIYIEYSIYWENPVKNRHHLISIIEPLDCNIDLLVLPEMFTTGFTMNASRFAETMSGETVQWLQKIALRKTMAITGSLIIKENGLFYNRMLFVLPTGEITYYDKRHLFTLAGEDKVFTPGTKKISIDYLGWKICPMICYDLRFPVWSRSTKDHRYDLLIYVANWPKKRIAAWETLLKARAIENMCYVLGVNRIGKDGVGITYPGESNAFDTLGNSIAPPPKKKEGLYSIELSKNHLSDTREKFRFLNDQDNFTLH